MGSTCRGMDAGRCSEGRNGPARGAGDRGVPSGVRKKQEEEGSTPTEENCGCGRLRKSPQRLVSSVEGAAYSVPAGGCRDQR